MKPRKVNFLKNFASFDAPLDPQVARLVEWNESGVKKPCVRCCCHALPPTDARRITVPPMCALTKGLTNERVLFASPGAKPHYDLADGYKISIWKTAVCKWQMKMDPKPHAKHISTVLKDKFELVYSIVEVRDMLYLHNFNILRQSSWFVFICFT